VFRANFLFVERLLDVLALEFLLLFGDRLALAVYPGQLDLGGHLEFLERVDALVAFVAAGPAVGPKLPGTALVGPDDAVTRVVGGDWERRVLARGRRYRGIGRLACRGLGGGRRRLFQDAVGRERVGGRVVDLRVVGGSLVASQDVVPIGGGTVSVAVLEGLVDLLKGSDMVLVAAVVVCDPVAGVQEGIVHEGSVDGKSVHGVPQDFVGGHGFLSHLWVLWVGYYRNHPDSFRSC